MKMMRVEMRRMCVAMMVFYVVYLVTTVQLYNSIDDEEAIRSQPPSVTDLHDDPLEPLHIPKKKHDKMNHAKQHKLHGEEILRAQSASLHVTMDDDPDREHHIYAHKPMPDPNPASNHKHVFKEHDYPPRPESPFETRTGEKLPEWAEKPFFFRHVVPEDKKICFVHVGKTAGSTLACHLGFRYTCSDHLRVPEGHMTERTTNLIHNNFNDCSDDMGYYMFATRNPLKRIQSWFTYERPPQNHGNGTFFQLKKPLFIDCPFATLNDLAERGLKPGGNASDVCHQRAMDAITGKKPFMRHNHYNYGKYLGQTPPKATLLAIRTEHMEEDWNSIEVDVLGGEPPKEFSFQQDNRSKKADEDKYLSEESQRLLCSALCQEIQTYKQILERAINLDDKQVELSLTELEETCPIEARQSNCTDTEQ